MRLRFFFLILTFLLFVAFAGLSSSTSASKLNPQVDITQLVRARINAVLQGQPLTRDWPQQHILSSSGNLVPTGQLQNSNYPVNSYRENFYNLLSENNIQVNDPTQESGNRVQNGTSTAVSGSNIVVAYNDIGVMNAGISYSNDGGATWQTTHVPEFPGGKNLGSGVVATDGKNFFYTGIVLTTVGAPSVVFSKSTDGGKTWSFPFGVQIFNNVNISQDKPWITVDTTDGPNKGTIYVSWTEFRFFIGQTGGRIVCASSKNGGNSFDVVTGVTPLSNFIYQGSTLAVAPNSTLLLAYGDLSVSGISFTRSTDGGKTFDAVRTAASLSRYQLIGPILNSHFGANGLPSLAVDLSNGPNRGTAYITFSAPSSLRSADKSEVYLVRSNDLGTSWTTPQVVNDDNTMATDQFMPSVAVANDGTVGLMWYDRRNNPIHNGLIDVYAAISSDGGKTFEKNRRLTTSNWLLLTTPIDVRPNYHGDYNQMCALSDQPGFFFAWGDDRSGLDADVYSTKLSVADFKQVATDLILSPTTTAQTVISGQGTQYRLQLKSSPGLAVPQFSASSDTTSATFSFDNQNLANGDILVRVRTNSDITPGSHPLIISATSGSITTSITLRLNVLEPGEFAHLPFKVASTASSSGQPAVALDKNGSVYTVWVDDFNGGLHTYFSRSSDGVNFSPMIDISNSNSATANPQIAVDQQGAIHVVWQDCTSAGCSTKYARSIDSGNTFEQAKVISSNVQFAEFPSLTINAQNEVVVFWDGIRSFNTASFEIFCTKSVDGGKKFSLPTTILNGGSRNLFTTGATSDNTGKTYLAYESCQDGNCRIEVRSSTNGFDNFSDAAIASDDLNFAIRPALAADNNGNLYSVMTVANSDTDPRFEIFSAVSADGGKTFSIPINISRSREASNDATIVADNQNVYVAWMDRTPGNPEIFLTRSTDQGKKFSPVVNLTNNSTLSQAPALAKDDKGNVQLVFQDDLDGNDEIYNFRLVGANIAPAINFFDPANGPQGTIVTLRGKGFEQTTRVAFGNTVADFFLNSPEELVAVVPAGAGSGAITLTTPGGTISSVGNFTVTSAISVGPNLLDFGTIIAGQVLPPQMVTIKNFSNVPLKISTISLSSTDYRIMDVLQLPLQLNSNESRTLQIAYQPTKATSSQATLKIVSSDSVLPTVNIALNGSATAPILTLLAPKGGEKLKGNSTFKIQWQADTTQALSFDLLLSIDGGKTFTTIIANALDSPVRSFDWQVFPVKSKLARVAVLMRTSGGGLFMSQSSGNFKIKVPK